MNRTKHPATGRRGLASVAIMIALLIIGLIGFAMLKVALARRGNLAAEERRLQVDWLAQAGLDRASARLSAAPDYPGERWEIPSEDLGGRGAAVVAIRVEPLADRPDSRKVRIEAEFPAGATHRARQGKDAVVEIIPQSR